MFGIEKHDSVEQLLGFVLVDNIDKFMHVMNFKTIGLILGTNYTTIMQHIGIQHS